ncbi:hypothetical protein NQZ68_035346 [Dissostichus eleginoides]|nr:hypothetical protein NQZ68_035346 [Dissostichus eleginoides]
MPQAETSADDHRLITDYNWRSRNPNQLSDLHERALASEVAGLPAPPAILPWRLRSPLWCRTTRLVGWTLRRDRKGRRVSRGLPLWCRKREVILREDDGCLQAGGGGGTRPGVSNTSIASYR